MTLIKDLSGSLINDDITPLTAIANIRNPVMAVLVHNLIIVNTLTSLEGKSYISSNPRLISHLNLFDKGIVFQGWEACFIVWLSCWFRYRRLGSIATNQRFIVLDKVRVNSKNNIFNQVVTSNKPYFIITIILFSSIIPKDIILIILVRPNGYFNS